MPPWRMLGWPFRAEPRAKRMLIALREEEAWAEEVEADEVGAG